MKKIESEHLTRSIAIIGILVFTVPSLPAPAADIYQANGIKIGEVTQTRAIIWTRLTQTPDIRWDGIPWPQVTGKKTTGDAGQKDYKYGPAQMPKDHKLADMEHIVPGATGQTCVIYWAKGNKKVRKATPWTDVDPARDFTLQFVIENLRPDTEYELMVIGRTSSQAPASCETKGRFRTAPLPSTAARVVFTVVTGQGFHRRDDQKNGHKIYPLMQALEPSFFAHTGDILYYDKPRPMAHSVELARLKWNRMYALPFQREFHKVVPSYFIKDDHDTWQNDCWPTMKNEKMGDFTFKQGLSIFLEQVPMGSVTFRTVRWGKDIQVWMVEGRDYRSANTMADGPNKTIWGAEQIAWFKRTVEKSDATFRVLISPTPLVGPDRENKKDNHSNANFKYEGGMLRNFISRQKNMVVVCGDRHWQYVTVDDVTGLREYSTGPTSNVHAGGFKEQYRGPEHRYLNIVGGFLSGTVERISRQPTLTFRHYSVDGKVLNEDRLVAE
ncbi:MAG: alkaline phosphatase D family protein [Planctomycetota bacterium]|jgi:alkaline phosphatase D